MKLRNEYEVTITPEGAWSIRHIHGEQCHQVAHGRVEETYNVMGRAEEAAQAWISTERNKRAEAARRARGNHVFTVKL